MNDLSVILLTVVAPPAINWAWNTLFGLVLGPYRDKLGAILFGWIGVTAIVLPVDAINQPWPWAVGDGLSLAIALAIWWYRRRKRRKIAAIVSERGRIIRAALVRAMRKAARPSPVLRPALGGAR
jgi:membrane protein implicated in regulation of membrane protease activity